MGTREPFFDIWKGFAIFLVIWGHSIQCLGGELFTSWSGKFIYLFHMPLFFFISGYVSVNALSRKFHYLLKTRLLTLFLPMCIWALIGLVIKIGLGIIPLESVDSWLDAMKLVILEIHNAYWFIWVLLLCIFFAWAILFVGRKHPVPFLFASLLVLWTMPEMPNGNAFKCMYPFFVGGYLFRYFRILEWMRNRLIPATIISGGGILICLLICKSS